VQALERLEELVGVLHVETRAIVADANPIFAATPFDIHANVRARIAASIFPGILQQVAHDRRKRSGIAPRAQARFDVPRHRAAGLLSLQFRPDRVDYRREVDVVTLQLAARAAGQLQQAIDEQTHVAACHHDLVKVSARFAVQTLPVVLQQRPAKAAHGSKRCSEVVADCIGKTVELAIGALQFGGALVDPSLKIRVQPLHCFLSCFAALDIFHH
jgi:hypothetical protein